MHDGQNELPRKDYDVQYDVYVKCNSTVEAHILREMPTYSSTTHYSRWLLRLVSVSPNGMYLLVLRSRIHLRTFRRLLKQQLLKSTVVLVLSSISVLAPQPPTHG